MENNLSLSDLLECVFSTWSPTIGDPTFTGWITVVAYLAAGCLSVLVVYRQSGRQRIFWCGLAVILFLLAINKQLDLQSALTAAGRCMAKAQGWYADRHIVQIRFILAIIGTSLIFTIFLAWAMRREFVHIWLALIGLTFLLAFVAIRAAGFHNFDQFIGVKVGGVRMNGFLELGGIAMICANAARLLCRKETDAS